MKKFIYPIIVIVWVSGLSGQALAYQQVPDHIRERANEYRRAAQEMLATGRVTDGVKMIRLAIKTNPLDPAIRMDYVGIMSRKGEQSLKDGNRREAIAVFASVEEELFSAAKLFMDRGANVNAAHCLGQVGDIHRHVYRKEGRARAYYQKALDLDPHSAPIQAKLSGR